jgi:hypothetical protein
MKSIKNQYIALKEGKMTEAQFMRNVRMTLPEYISNVTLFKQAEKILINKGIISEIKENSLYSSQHLIQTLTPKIEKDVEVLKKQFPKYNISLDKNKYENDDSYTLSTSGKNTSDIDNEKLEKIVTSKIKDTIVEDKDKKSNIQKLIDAGYSESDAEDLADEFEQGGVKVPQKVKDILNEINTDGLKQMGYSDSDIEDFMDEWKQGGSKLPEKVRDYLDGLYNTRLGQLKTKSLREAKDKLSFSQLKKGDTLTNKFRSGREYRIIDIDSKSVTVKNLQTGNTLVFYSLNNYELKNPLNEAKEGYYNQDGKEQYGKFDELDNMNAQEIMAGYVLEKIDNPDKDKMEICKLVIKNLKKDQFYYTNYKLTGVRDQQPTEFTSTKRKPGFDQAEEVSKKADNLKDTKNATTIVKEGLSEVATDEKLDEAQKSKLKMAIRKVMKEMFDGMEPLSRTGLDENAKALKNLEVGDVFRVVKEKVAGVRENTNYEITMLGNYLLDFKTVKNPEHAALGQTGTMSVDRFKENVLSGDIIIYPK